MRLMRFQHGVDDSPTVQAGARVVLQHLEYGEIKFVQVHFL
jgi:hypothetical protein